MHTERTALHPAHPSRTADAAEFLHGEHLREPLPDMVNATDSRFFEKPRVTNKRPRIKRRKPESVLGS